MPVRAVFYTAKGAVTIKSAVRSLDPICLVANSLDAEMVAAGDRALVVYYNRGSVYRAEAQAGAVTRDKGEWIFEIRDESWEKLDRRRFGRQESAGKVEIATVRECDGVGTIHRIQGEIKDLSVGGAWIVTPEPLEEGSLVDFRGELPGGVTFKVMAVVTSRKADGFGTEFVDYFANAREVLHAHLKTPQAA